MIDVGLRPEHLEGIIRRIDNNERMVKALIMNELIETASSFEGAKSISVKLKKIADDIFFDRGEWTKEDLKKLVDEAFKDAPPSVKLRTAQYMEFIL